MESISRVSGLLGNTRDLTLEAARDALLQRRSTPPQASPQQLKKLLDSRHEQEVLNGLRQLVSTSQRSSRVEAAQFLPIALKSISSPNANIRKLVYIYLLENAESDPDTALLSINSIQKALSASDPQLRALALRTISSLKVPVIAQIVSLGIRKGAADMSPIVRRTAALAIPKCWKLDLSTAPQLDRYIAQLLGDRQYYVVSAALLAFNEYCPQNIDLLHSHYRSLVKMLVDMDEWGQLAALRTLTYYARRCFPQRKKRAKNDSKSESDDYDTREELDPDLELLLRSAQPLLHSHSSAVVISVTRLYMALAVSPGKHQPSPYLQAIVGPLVALLRSSSEIVPIVLHNILQVLLLYPQLFVRYTRHFLLHSTDTAEMSLSKLEALGFLFPYAPRHVQSSILAELTHAVRSPDTTIIRASVAALGRCANSADPSSSTSRRCLSLLLAQISTPAASTQSGDGDVAANGLVAAEALTQIRHLIQADPSAHRGTVIRLAKDLDSITHPAARASIVWLVGEFATTDETETDTKAKGKGKGRGLGSVAADVLRILAKGFKHEEEAVKKQILLLSTKVYLTWLNARQPSDDADKSTSNPEADDTTPSANGPELHKEAEEPHAIPLLYAYVHSLIRYDTSYTIRDMARVHRALLPPLPSSNTNDPSLSPTATDVNTQLATLLFQCPKPVPTNASTVKAQPASKLGSASLVLGGEELPGYEDLPDWASPGEEPDPRLRDRNDGLVDEWGGRGGAGPVSASARLDTAPGVATGVDRSVTGKATGGKTLDDWLDESSSGSEEEEEEDESSEDGDEEEGSEETTSAEGSNEESESEEDERGKLMKL